MAWKYKKHRSANFLFTTLPFYFLLSSLPLHAQTNYREGFHNLSRPEKWWVIFHPFIAKKTFRLTQDARNVSKEMVKKQLLDGDENGGQVDAFRHAYWMALLSQHICWRKACWLGKAHEKGNYLDFKKHKTEEGILPDSISGAMDLFNNRIGIEIGRVNKKVSEADLQSMVRDSILSGKMKVIYKNRNGEPLDCDSKVIDVQKYRQQWNIPKCLMNSNYR
jgi:hypothetical protein